MTAPSLPVHVQGHPHADSPLSTRRAFPGLPVASRPLVFYRPEELWELDTRRLPWVLARERRRLRAFAERELVPRAVPVDLAPHPEPGACPTQVAELLSIAAREGLLTDLLPWPLGTGSPLTLRYPLNWYHALRCEELARADGGLMLLLSAHALGAGPLLISGDLGALWRFMLPAFRESLRGEPHLFAFAITEPALGSDAEDGHGAALARPGTVARRVDGGWSISGRKTFISGGDLARSVTLFAALEGEGMESWTCFLVRSDMPGFRVARTELKMGMRASGAAELELEEVFVPDGHVIGGLRNGWALNRAVLNTSRIPVAGMAAGFAQGALEAAMDFACRVRLGRRELIHFQEVQLLLSEMIARTTSIRSLAWHLASSGLAPRQAAASMAKFRCTDVGAEVCELAMELMGNHGMLHANHAERAFRDARLVRIFEGTNQINRLSVIEDCQEELLARIARHRTEDAR